MCEHIYIYRALHTGSRNVNKKANFKCQQLEIGLEFAHGSFDKRNNFSKGERCQVIRVGASPMPILCSFQLPVCNARPIDRYIICILTLNRKLIQVTWQLYCAHTHHGLEAALFQ